MNNPQTYNMESEGAMESVSPGKSVTDICEAEAGSLLHVAITLEQAQGACEAAYEELRYGDGAPRALLDALQKVSQAELRLDELGNLVSVWLPEPVESHAA